MTSEELQNLLRQNKTSRIFFNNIRPSQQTQLLNWITEKESQGLNLSDHIAFLLEVQSLQEDFYTYEEQIFFNALNEADFNYPKLTIDQYDRHWMFLQDQTTSQRSTYHSVFHALQVAASTLRAAQNLSVFHPFSAKISDLLIFLLITASKYHDLVQWRKDHISISYLTAEEETAAALSDRIYQDLIKSLPEVIHSTVKLFMELFFKKTIGLGTKILFISGQMITVSFLHDEITHLLFPEKTSPKLLTWIDIITEILSLVDKASQISPALLLNDPPLGPTTELTTFFEHLNTINWYCPDLSIEINLKIFSAFHVAHFLMQLEDQNTNERALSLRKFIQIGQQLVIKEKYNEIDAHVSAYDWDTMAQSLEIVYFNKIAAECSFVSKLEPACHHSISKLQQLGLEDVEQFFNANICSKEVGLLTLIKNYFTELPSEQKTRLTQELMMIAVSQPGTAYARAPQRIHETEPESLAPYFY